MIGSPTYEKQFEGVKFIIMYSFLTCRRFLHNKEVDNTDIYLEIYIFRVDNYAGNASGEQSSSENCNQFSVLGSGF